MFADAFSESSHSGCGTDEIAETLLTAHGAASGLRALDALQLAVALDLHRDGLIESIITADKVMLRVAPVENLPVVNPDTPAL